MKENKQADKHLVFACDFGRGLRVVLKLDPEVVRNRGALPGAMTFEWSGPVPTSTIGRRKVLSDYLAWKHGVMQRIADHTGVSILDLIQTDCETVLMREYRPNRAD